MPFAWSQPTVAVVAMTLAKPSAGIKQPLIASAACVKKQEHNHEASDLTNTIS